MIFTDAMLYSRGVYWLFEHWQEDGKNIYSKSKYRNFDEFMKGAGRILDSNQLDKVKKGDNVLIKNEDGTTFFFKFVNNP